nr:uncharacterized protein LOC120362702 [Saimiri boliviensis boliviensis]
MSSSDRSKNLCPVGPRKPQPGEPEIQVMNALSRLRRSSEGSSCTQSSLLTALQWPCALTRDKNPGPSTKHWGLRPGPVSSDAKICFQHWLSHVAGIAQSRDGHSGWSLGPLAQFLGHWGYLPGPPGPPSCEGQPAQAQQKEPECASPEHCAQEGYSREMWWPGSAGDPWHRRSERPGWGPGGRRHHPAASRSTSRNGNQETHTTSGGGWGRTRALDSQFCVPVSALPSRPGWDLGPQELLCPSSAAASNGDDGVARQQEQNLQLCSHAGEIRAHGAGKVSGGEDSHNSYFPTLDDSLSVSYGWEHLKPGHAGGAAFPPVVPETEVVIKSA